MISLNCCNDFLHKIVWAVSGLYVGTKGLQTVWCISSSIMHHFSKNWQPGVNSENDVTVDESKHNFLKDQHSLGFDREDQTEY